MPKEYSFCPRNTTFFITCLSLCTDATQCWSDFELWHISWKSLSGSSKECLSLKGPLYDNLLANQRRTPSGCGIALIINRQPWNHSPAYFVFVWSREPFRMICFRVVSCLLPTCFRSLRLPQNRLVHPPHASAIPSNKERHLEISVLNYVILCPDFCVNSIDIWL